ncbi:MAG: four helix bundle protein [Kiritimatiellia bacterium]|jgi:four helix bundle protein
MTNTEFKVWLKARTRKFAVDVFHLVDALPTSPSMRVVSFQLGKAASSIGANYREATRASSNADFNFKVGLCEKEADESLFWLEILKDMHSQPNDLANQVEVLYTEAQELLRLFVSISRTCRENKRTPVATPPSHLPTSH